MLIDAYAESRHNAQPSVSPGECRNCGTRNEPTFTYCRLCVSKLP